MLRYKAKIHTKMVNKHSKSLHLSPIDNKKISSTYYFRKKMIIFKRKGRTINLSAYFVEILN